MASRLSLLLVLLFAAPAGAQLSRVSSAVRGDSDDSSSSRRGGDTSDTSDASDASGSSSSGGSWGSRGTARPSSTGGSVRVRAPIARRLLTPAPPPARARAGTATIRAAHVTPTRPRVSASTGPRPVRVVSTTPPGATTPDALCPDPTIAGFVGVDVFAAPPTAQAADLAPKDDEAVRSRVVPARRTRAHLGLDVGPTRMHGFDGRILRTSFDGRVQFRRSVDLDLGYALLADGETTLGLLRLGGAVRVLDGDRGFLRLGASALRLRDPLGPVHGGELLFGLGAEGRRFSTLFDAAVGRLGRSWSIALRWTVGILLTRGLELVLGVDHLTLAPSDVPDATVRMTTPTAGLRILL